MNEQLLQQLQDEREIHAVLIEYCCALDRMDLVLLSTLFTDNCVVDYGPDERLQSHGAASLAKSLERMWRWSRTSHHLSNVQIQFTGETEASASSYVHAWHERADGSSATILGQYHDRFVRSNGGWKIAARQMFMNGCDAGFKVNINRFDRLSAPDGWVTPDLDEQKQESNCRDR